MSPVCFSCVKAVLVFVGSDWLELIQDLHLKDKFYFMEKEYLNIKKCNFLVLGSSSKVSG